jgi:hypothetical protein
MSDEALVVSGGERFTEFTANHTQKIAKTQSLEGFWWDVRTRG